jgi:hypothetical protein
VIRNSRSCGIGESYILKIHLVDDAVPQREPDARTAVVRSADAVLGTARPAGLDAWRPEGEKGLIHRST